jgi:hypothetical protein
MNVNEATTENIFAMRIAYSYPCKCNCCAQMVMWVFVWKILGTLRGFFWGRWPQSPLLVASCSLFASRGKCIKLLLAVVCHSDAFAPSEKSFTVAVQERGIGRRALLESSCSEGVSALPSFSLRFSVVGSQISDFSFRFQFLTACVSV